MPICLTIDGREVEVDEGASILDAARKLGIDLPTLCHQDGLEPVGSCFLCVVEVEGLNRLVPSCTARAEDGMAVTTDSPEIRAARKMALELLLSDHTGDCEAPCTLACPAGLDIPGFIRHIAAGRRRQAIALIKESIPLAGALGRICPRFCERVCRRGELDAPIAVCALKRFAADADLATHDCYVPPQAEPTGKRVAVVGAGPAGLSAAAFLLAKGHACTVLDERLEPGGMFRYAIPEFRLPADALDGDIDVIRRSGAVLRRNVRVGRDVSLEELREEFDAVFLAIGAQLEPKLECEGGELAASALEFLSGVAEGRRPDVAGGCVVIGGGNEAVDAARTAVRLGAQPVTVLWEKDRRAMPAFGESLAAAEAEGVELELLARPSRIEKTEGGGLAISCQRGGGSFRLEVSYAVHAPARRVDASLVESVGLAVSNKGIQADRHTLATGVDGVFAGGECVSGPRAGVRAVAAGRRAAVSIHQYLSGLEVAPEPKPINVRLGKLTPGQIGILKREFGERDRVDMPLVEMARRRVSFTEVERGLPEGMAIGEARRCLQCDCIARDTCKLRRYATEYGADVGRFKGEKRPFARDLSHPEIVYEPGKCILCGLCVRLAAQAGEKLGMSFWRRGFITQARVPFEEPLADGLAEIGARCAAACPTGALALKRELPAESEPASAIPNSTSQIPDPGTGHPPPQVS